MEKDDPFSLNLENLCPELKAELLSNVDPEGLEPFLLTVRARLEAEDKPLQKAQLFYAAGLRSQDVVFGSYRQFSRAGELFSRAGCYTEAADSMLEAAKCLEAQKLRKVNFLGLGPRYSQKVASANKSLSSLEVDYVIHLRRKAIHFFDIDGNPYRASQAHIDLLDYEKATGGFVKRLFLKLYRVTSLYGESPTRVLLFALICILACAIFFYASGIRSNGETIHSFSDSLFLSVVTFTTLGYGDLTPNNGLSKIIAGAEAVLGLILTSLFLVTFVRKYSR